MADVQRLVTVEEAAKKPSDYVAADPVGGVIASGSIDMVMEEAKALELLKSTFSGDNLGEGSVVETVAAVDKKAAVEVSEVETVPVLTTKSVTKTEELVIFTGIGMNDEKVKLSRVGEEREEANEGERRSNMQPITLEYDDSLEVTELDLAKISGYTPHCPNCTHRIIKVILRRKQKVIKPSVYDKIWVYCIQCVMIVRTTVSWHTISQVVTKIIHATQDGKVISPSSGSVPKIGISEKTNEDEGGKVQIDSTNNAINPPNDINPQPDNLPEKKIDEVKIDGGEDKPQVVPRDDEDVTGLDTKPPEPGTTVITIDNTKIHEILKCVVYGGLIESITSLSVVASVAGTDATTLNVLAIGLALLFSGLIAFCFNLLDLKNDAYSIKKYNELLGLTKDNFRLHATCAILSYFISGLIAPTTYAIAFHESDNKEYKIIVAAVAAFVCIFLLAMAKAYVTRKKDNHPRYVETTRYYLIIAFSVSGVAYAVGYMIEMLMLGLGLFRSVQRVTCYVPDQRISATPTWASY